MLGLPPNQIPAVISLLIWFSSIDPVAFSIFCCDFSQVSNLSPCAPHDPLAARRPAGLVASLMLMCVMTSSCWSLLAVLVLFMLS